jgi:methanogenic corrinoid protein MtbC1
VQTTQHSIASISSLTGIAKEVLRKWEDRYGFPLPARDSLGRRVYDAGQLSRLLQIKLLMDRGCRAGQVVALSLDGLASLQMGMPTQTDCGLTEDMTRDVIAALKNSDPQTITHLFNRELALRGLRDFVCQLLPALSSMIGHAWADGRIGVRHEHLYSEHVQALLTQAINSIEKKNLGPRIVMSTPSGEQHTMGLLMAQLMLTLEGGECIPLGGQLAADELLHAAIQFEADVISLSFSEAFPIKKAIQFLTHLRAHCPHTIRIWASGSGVTRNPPKIAGVDIITSLEHAIDALRAYRLVH